MKALVTGGAGFIGSQLVNKLIESGIEVRVVDNLSKGEIKNIKHDNYEFMNLDITKDNNAVKALEDCDICFHLAAKIGGVSYFHNHPVESLDSNMTLLSSIFNAALKTNLKKMVYVSSSMVFERAKHFPYKEDQLKETPAPITHYGFAKLAGEYYCTGYYEQYGLKYVIVRPFNAYGPGEIPEDEVGIAHVIPDLIKKTLRGDYPLEIIGDGDQTRCFTYVEDVAEGILAASKAECEDFNISSKEETKIKDLAKMIWNLCERKEELKIKNLPALKYDVRRRVPSIEKAKKLLNWEPKTNLEQGLVSTIDYVKKVMK